MNPPARFVERAAPFVCCAAVIAALLVLIGRDYPIVGHDFRYFLPHLLDTDLHLRINGLSIQWYTPTFGGGLPAFANPQHIEFSLPQALLLITGPWTAILLSTAIVSALGYAACYAFLRRRLGLERIPAALGALFFIGNGFSIEHLIAGHLNFQLFPIAAVMLYVLTNRRQTVLTNGCLAALSMAAMVHQAGPLLLILSIGSIVLAGPLVYAIDPASVDWRRAVAAGALAVPLALGIAGSKVFAVQSLMRQFPREVADHYAVGALHGVAGVATQLLGGMVIIPALLIAGRPPQQIDGTLAIMTGSPWRVWEVDTGLSPVLSIVLVIGAVGGLASWVRRGLPRPPAKTVAMLIALGIASWIVVEAAIAKGLVYPLLRQLPVLRSLHVNTRFAAVFILPLTILGAVWLHRWYRQGPPRWQVAIVAGVSLAAPLLYVVLPARTHLRSFDVTSSVRDHARIRNGERFPIRQIADVWDVDAFETGSSSARPYEPLFGYFLETFAPRTHVGSIFDERDGHLNMTNPASLVFPEFYHLRPFDLISAADRANLERLAARRQPDWARPPIVDRLNLVAAMTCAGCVILAALGAARRGNRPARP